jgi:hypothetical protein
LKLPLEALSEKNRNSLESIVSGTNAPGQPAAVGQTAAPAAGGKPQTVRQNGFTYTLQPDGTYK